MKKVPLLFKSFFAVLFLLFCSAGVFAANAVSDNVPKKINVQGKLTTDSGQPITGTKTVKLKMKVDESDITKSSTVSVDSDGIYSANIDVSGVEFSKKVSSFTVTIEGGETSVTSQETPFAASPYAFYASSSTYALVLSTSSSIKLEDGNFYEVSSHTYTIKVGTAAYAVSASSMVQSGSDGQVWGIEGNVQKWRDPGSLSISAATVDKLGGIRLGKPAHKTGLIMKEASRLAISTGTGLSINNSGQLTLADKYGDSKNPYEEKAKNLVLAGPASGNNAAPTFRALVLADIPLESKEAKKDGTDVSLVTTGEKYTWNNKQDALSSQEAYTNQGSTTKVPQISTNELGQVIKITEVDISQQVVNNNKITIQKNGTEVGNFTLNQSSDKAINIEVPDIPTIGDAEIEIQKNGTKVDSFTTNQSGNKKTINITVPTKTNDLENNSNFIADENYVHTDSNYTSAEKSKLSGIAEGAQENVLEGVQLNGSDLPISGKKVNISVSSLGSYSTDNTSITGEGNVLKAVGINNKDASVSADNGDTIYVWAATGSDKATQGWYEVDIKERNLYGNRFNNLEGADLAEIYQSTEKLVPGDVVSIDTTKDNAIVKTKVAEDTLVAGVISTEPGLLMNQNEKGYKLALVGKVPTKVCNEGGAIKRGDLLVSASVPGYAKKAGANPKVGTVIGKALENLDSQKGTILVLVNLQ